MKQDETFNPQLPRVAAAGLVIGAILGMVGTFLPPPLRGLAWGLDGTALTVAAAMLTIHQVRRGNDLLASGFLVFAIGQALILAVAATDLPTAAHIFASGVALWAASLAMVTASNTMPALIRAVGAIASILFAVVAVQIFVGHALTPLSQPLPFLAYPFLAVTLFGWAWVHYRSA